MAIARGSSGTERRDHPAISPLTSDDLARVAGEHLTELADHQRRSPSQSHVTSLPRLRHVGRALVLGWVSIVETLGDAWRWVWNPRRFVGRWAARVRLLHPFATFSPWLLLLVLFAVGIGVATLEVLDLGTVGKAVAGGLFGGAVAGVLALLWNDLVRCPWLSLRIRWQLRRHPERLLLSNLRARQAAELTVGLDREIVPRTELYDDLLPGVLTRGRKDVQVVVGEPGAGKTTALLGIAALLARTGIVPVLVPLRAEGHDHLVDEAKSRFTEQIDQMVRSDGEVSLLWRWLCRRGRVVILTDDIDQIGPDGERGFVLRRTLEEAAATNLSVIVTARPAGVPAGVAASAIELGSLGEPDAIAHVLRSARRDPSFGADVALSARVVRAWVVEGKLAEAPFYLELLAQLVAVGACPELPAAGRMWTRTEDHGRVRRLPDGTYAWNPLWVRFMLLEHFYEQTAAAQVRRSLGIERIERASTLLALERAALGTLVATSLKARLRLRARKGAETGSGACEPQRWRIQEFLDTDDRDDLVRQDRETRPADARLAARKRHRQQVSAAEVIDTGERLFLLDRNARNEPQFRHRIMQAYLAARCLVRKEHAAQAGNRADTRPDPVETAPEQERDWIVALLDHHHPEKLTAHMALEFAALRATREARAPAHPAGGEVTATEPSEAQRRDHYWKVVTRIVDQLIAGARRQTKGEQDPNEDTAAAHPRDTVVTVMTEGDGRATMLSVAVSSGEDGETAHAARPDDPEPLVAPDPERRVDPDDALTKLTTAARIADAVADPEGGFDVRAQVGKIIKEVQFTNGASRWTKLDAIAALSTMKDDLDGRWTRIWDFARDLDNEVRRAASAAIQEDAYGAFRALVIEIERLLSRAAARSAYHLWLTRPQDDGSGRDGAERHDIATWTQEDVLRLRALGWVLPAVVSGFREERRTDADGASALLAGRDGRGEERAGDAGQRASEEQALVEEFERVALERRARQALESLVALAFEGGHEELEANVAQGFKGDAMRHARDPQRRVVGPGWVTSNRRLVADVCLDHAGFWYARMVLYQALALYAVAGADANDTLDVFARLVHRGGKDRHPFTQRAARLALAAVRRHQLSSHRWGAYVWDDEGLVAARRAPGLSDAAAQLAGDVTILLNLKEGTEEHYRDSFAHMQELPYCLSRSRDRAEILGAGCPASCGWRLCPYRQPPPDEPNDQRGVSRAFCRQQREIARHRRPRWQPTIRGARLRAFWREMERRARS